jgi:type I restriction enzyme S subunit
MGNNVTFGHYATVRSGFAFKSSSWRPSGFPVVKIKNVGDGVVDLNGCAFVDEETAKRASKFLAQSGDVLVSLTGYVGQVGRVQEGTSVLVNQRVGFVSPKDEEDKSFVYFLLRFLRPQVERLGVGSAQANVAPRDIMALEVPYFGISERRRIAKSLDVLEQKINLNKKTSMILESFASAQFKSWFIDFDPVRAKMAGEETVGVDREIAKLFPDEMEESELGEIPLGWELVGADDIAFTTIGGLWGDDDSSDGSSSYYCLRGTDLDDLKVAGLADRAPLRWNQGANIGKRLLENRHVLIGGSGAGPVGKSLLWDSSVGGLFDRPVIFSNFVKRFETRTQAEATFLYFVLQDMLSSGEMFDYVAGTSVPNLLDKDLLQSKNFVIPPEPLLVAFDNFYRATLRLKYSGQSRYLSQMRDVLLPRLISGEVEIPEEMLVA